MTKEIPNRFNIPYDRGSVVGTPKQRFLLSGTDQLQFALVEAEALWRC